MFNLIKKLFGHPEETPVPSAYPSQPAPRTTSKYIVGQEAALRHKVANLNDYNYYSYSAIPDITRNTETTPHSWRVKYITKDGETVRDSGVRSINPNRMFGRRDIGGDRDIGTHIKAYLREFSPTYKLSAEETEERIQAQLARLKQDEVDALKRDLGEEGYIDYMSRRQGV